MCDTERGKLFEYYFLVFLCLSAPSKYKGVIFEQFESIWAQNPRSVTHVSLKTKQNRKQDKKTRHKYQNKVNK